ncbi:hypothetical protein ECANGB1_961 [Enterospora canceri]|uniref:Uncharacterized protein n=1 Tax=Enterospora canceri TaxID=1081671 RepID=A0A1Y1S748_9MICR|nr:hypothetical protein ECANGB1_961 [Enterospora canceri]
MMTKEEAQTRIRTQVMTMAEMRRLVKEHGLVVKFGQFSRKEREIIDGVILEHMREQESTMDELGRWTIYCNFEAPQEYDTFDARGLICKIVDKLKHRAFLTVYREVAFLYNPYRKREFTAEDDRELLRLIKEHGTKYKKFQPIIEHAEVEIAARYTCVLAEIEVKYVTAGALRRIEATGLPRNREELKELAKAFGVEEHRLHRAIVKYLNGKAFGLLREKLVDAEFALELLRNNFQCSVSVDIDRIIGVVRDSETEGISSAREFVLRLFEDEELEKRDLRVRIEMEDIFWDYFSKKHELSYHSAMTRYKGIARRWGWRMFRDVYASVKEMLVSFLEDRIRQDAAEKHSNRK